MEPPPQQQSVLLHRSNQAAQPIPILQYQSVQASASVSSLPPSQTPSPPMDSGAFVFGTIVSLIILAIFQSRR
jgi:hypothetical protein